PAHATRGSMGPKLLLVGAGAVGQAYGHCLLRGGADVTFLVKESHRREVDRPLTVYPLNERRRWQPVPFSGFSVATQPSDARFDQIWLCVSPPALEGEWLGRLLARAGD